MNDPSIVILVCIVVLTAYAVKISPLYDLFTERITPEIAWPLPFEPSSDGRPAAIHDADGKIICTANYSLIDDFNGDVTRSERVMKRLVELANRRYVTGRYD